MSQFLKIAGSGSHGREVFDKAVLREKQRLPSHSQTDDGMTVAPEFENEPALDRNNGVLLPGRSAGYTRFLPVEMRVCRGPSALLIPIRIV